MISLENKEDCISEVNDEYAHLGQLISSLPKNNKISQSRKVLLFFSFDIVNSSMFKSQNSNWYTTFKRIFDFIAKNIKKEIPNVNFWRLIGDEIVFFVQVNNLIELGAMVDVIYKVLIFGKKEIQKETQFTYNFVSLQGAAWIALVNNLDQISNIESMNDVPKGSSNVYFEYDFKYYFGISPTEFLGSDIDAGFRMSAFHCERRLSLSFELAYLLHEQYDYMLRMHIITFRKLKGIWNDGLYPIIWYYNPSHNSNTNFEDSFYYDEASKNELVYDYFFNKDSTILLPEGIDQCLEKICKDRHLENKIIEIKEVISEASDGYYYNNVEIELHCVAVCVNLQKMEALIFKRNSRKTPSPLDGKWEFGCAKIRKGKSSDISEALISEYKSDFNIQIIPYVDEKRNDKQPVPIALYTINKESGSSLGIITIAEISNDSALKLTDKHKEYKYISEEDIQNFNDDTVDDFKDTLKKVFDFLKAVKSNDE